MMRLVAGLIGNTGVMYNNEAQFAKTCKKNCCYFTPSILRYFMR